MKKSRKRERRGAYERDFTLDKGRDLENALEVDSGPKLSRKSLKDHSRKD